MAKYSGALSNWLKVRHAGGAVEAQLQQSHDGEKSEILATRDLTGERSSVATWDQLAEDFLAIAQGAQDGARRRLRFVVVTKQLDDKSESFPFTVPRTAPTYNRQQPGDALIAQAYRHNEALINALLNERKTVSELHSKTIESLSETLRKKDELLQKLLADKETAEIASHERRLEIAKVTAEEARKDKLALAVYPLLPHVVNKLAGKNLLETGKSSAELALEAAFANLTDEQIEFLKTSFLTPEQLIAIEPLLPKAKNPKEQTDER